jgi:uncharacterized membrane protein YgcG
MKTLWSLVGRAVTAIATVSLTAAAATMPAPGTINYVEGQVTLDGQSVAVSSPNPVLVATNQTLDTSQGMAEMLLTPGVFLRLGSNSEVRMVSPGLADTSVALLKGSAMLEAAELFKQNNLSVMVGGAIVRIDKQGLYDINAYQLTVTVLDGEATVSQGNAHLNLKKGHILRLAAGQPFKAQKFDENAVQADPLYRWSALRSQYDAQANIGTAETIVMDGGWFGAGWYWDPFWDCYAFLPGSGILYSPFGWGFYAPGWVWQAPHHPFYPHQPPPGKPGGKNVSASAKRAVSGRGAGGGAAHAGGGFGHAGGGLGHGGGGGGSRGGSGRR